jgi:hypothetical protein
MSFTLVTTSRSLHRSHMSGRTHALSIGTDLRAPQPGSAAIKTTSAVDCTGSAWSFQFQFVRAFARTPGATAQNPCRWLVLGTLYFCFNAARRRHRGPPGQSRSLKPAESNWILDNYSTTEVELKLAHLPAPLQRWHCKSNNVHAPEMMRN